MLHVAADLVDDIREIAKVLLHMISTLHLSS